MKKGVIWSIAILILTVSITTVLRIDSTYSDSPTTDETVHLASGYTFLTRHEARFDPEHPPLYKALSALPLIVTKPKLPKNLDRYWNEAEPFYLDSWSQARQAGNDLFFASGNNPSDLLLLGRIAGLVLSGVTLIVIYLLANKLFGSWSAAFATLLMGFFPLFLGHGHLINTDAAITLGFILTIWAWVNFLEKPNGLRILLVALALGFAALTKFTFLTLFPILAILGCVRLIQLKRFPLISILRYLAILLLSVWLLILLVYGPNRLVAPAEIPADYYRYVPGWVAQLVETIRPILVPAPFFKGLFMVITHTVGGHDTYLLGEFSKTGWWYYFPLTIWFKTQVAFFILLIVGVIAAFTKRTKFSLWQWALVFTPLIYLAAAMASKADLGQRHIMPIYPFIFIWISQFVIYRWFVQIPMWGLLGWYIFAAVKYHPHYLPYFNELAGGPKNGYKYLLDSNLEWGQDLKRLGGYIRDKHPSAVYYQYGYLSEGWLGPDAASAYGIEARPLPERKQMPGAILIVGAGDYMRNPELQKHKIVDRVGYSILILDASPSLN